MIVKRTFVTKLEPVDAFGLSNELLRPRGFVLDKGTPPRSQAWRRGVEPGQKSKNLFDARQTIEMEFSHGRVNVTASATVSGRDGIRAQKMLTSYAEALEHLLTSGHTPEVAGLIPKQVEGSLRRAKLTRTLSVCGALAAVLIGGIAALKFMPGNVPSSLRWLTGGLADGKKKPHTPPVVVVRRAGEEASAEAHKTLGN